jgi:cyclic beta-1,2-glucan synthetase
MNSVGDEGRGESVWLGFFLADILHHFIPICETRGEQADAERYRTYLADLETALNDTGWDGEWYRRAYYDNGAPMGSAENEECRIDAIAQGWSVLSGVAPPERVEQALDAAEEHLIRDDESLIRLLTPPFDKTEHDPGYIKGYVPGVRENGGQYTHGVLWLVRAFAEAGRTDRAAELLAMLSPVHHTRDTDAADRYKTEPYVVAADVYSVAPHVGRGGWTWYTGSAGWTFRVALESILGFRIEGGETLVLDPCIPSDWPGFSIRYRLPVDGGTVEIEVTRGEAKATFDDAPVETQHGAVRVALPRDGGAHRLHLTLPTS